MRGAGEVEDKFFDDGNLIGIEIYLANEGDVTADLDGRSFDAVTISAVDDTAFSLDGFLFDRLVVDEFLLS